MMLLMQTDLPLPVAPAISRCGMSISSQTMGVPVMSLPRATAVGERDSNIRGEVSTSRRYTLLVRSLDTSRPTKEVPGMEYASIKTGEWAGFIGVNEMLAFKLPMGLYKAFMKEAHHDAPLREEDKLEEVAQMMREQAERAGSKLIEGDGMEELRHDARAPLEW